MIYDGQIDLKSTKIYMQKKGLTMRIINYYRGGTDKLSGFVYDTDTKTYKEFAIAGKDWTENFKKDNTLYSRHKKNFKIPADIDYFFPTKGDMTKRLDTIKKLKFKKDNKMILDFGVCIL